MPPSILLVEDDEQLREILADTLFGEGYEVVRAVSGEAALAAAKKKNFDAILSDIEMKNGTGLWLLSELRARGICPPVILMSGNAEFTYTAMRELGAYDFIAKPFRTPAILEKLKAALFSNRVKQVVG